MFEQRVLLRKNTDADARARFSSTYATLDSSSELCVSPQFRMNIPQPYHAAHDFGREIPPCSNYAIGCPAMHNGPQRALATMTVKSNRQKIYE